MNEIFTVYYDSPIGMLSINGREDAVLSILFDEEQEQAVPPDENTPYPVRECYLQLDEYFKGNLKDFNFPYRMEGTPFQKSVWKGLTIIPYGQTWSYKDLAVHVGNEKAVRAVGTTNSKNQLSIVVPCHRVIGSNGKLTGYAGGVWRKEWLLNHEKKNFTSTKEGINLSLMNN
ncbi:methylated-DNA--[protein]-cysteine S-methyltransferase [Falsibacillus pallidus]|uniref:Methylated-DNA--protein-cysteine methyltransferase n=1 Tax=Falsibacillus pallidus TaxID=493781 RepID=A0A370GT22_9BACI|nr:methylated-DNA--[protein]-cysteine S-methyltransferase [Falsibacillus pallidus]RDI45674.1 methylated-DNA-[protein]-cysteine S-methyltransferase [Falsibacillus pallidus]